jgi:hypothetical protein
VLRDKRFDVLKVNLDVVQIDATYKNNKFDMPLLHAIGTTCRQKAFDISFSFMCGEEAGHYAWHIQAIRELFELQVTPRCFLTDHDTALKAALTAIYLGIPQRLCIWHINQNVQAQAVEAWDIRRAKSDDEKTKIEEERLGFMSRWYTLLSKETEE